MRLLAPSSLFRRVRADANRNIARVKNGAQYFAELRKPELGLTAKELVWSRDKVCLYRFSGGDRSQRVPVLLVYSLVGRPNVFDLRPGNSYVERMLERGFDVFLLDWGVPDAADSQVNLESYCDEYIPMACKVALQASAATEITVFGYCLGAVFSALFAAGHPEIPLANLVLQTTPIDFRAMGPACKMFVDDRVDPTIFLDETGNLPPSAVLKGMRMPNPTKHLLAYVDLIHNSHNQAHLSSYQTMVGWSNAHIPIPGAVFLQAVDLFIRQNLLMTGRVPLGDRVVDLADIRCNVLVVTADRDDLVPAEASDPLVGLLTGATVSEIAVPAGHVGLVAGRRAHTEFIPQTLDWLEQHSN
jgi:polyhydroxyalkanoate synthase subunit PhaC